MEYVKKDNALGDVFVVDNDTLEFNSGIAQEYVSEAWKMAFERYNPEKMV